MNAPQLFTHEQFGEIRVIDRDGEPVIVAKDVADAMGYNPGSKVGMIFKHVPDGKNRLVMTPKVTAKGQQYFINKFLREAETMEVAHV